MMYLIRQVSAIKILTFPNITLKKLTNAPPYVSNHTLHTNLKIKSITEKTKIFYKRFHNRLNNHSNQLLKNLATPSILGNPHKRLKR